MNSERQPQDRVQRRSPHTPHRRRCGVIALLLSFTAPARANEPPARTETSSSPVNLARQGDAPTRLERASFGPRPPSAPLYELGAGFVGGVLGAGAAVLLAARPLCGSELRECAVGARLAFVAGGYSLLSPVGVWVAGESTAGQGSLAWTYASQGVGFAAASGVVGLGLLDSARSGDVGYSGTGIAGISWVLLAPTLLMAAPVLGYEWSDRRARRARRSSRSLTIVPWVTEGGGGARLIGVL